MGGPSASDPHGRTFTQGKTGRRQLDERRRTAQDEAARQAKDESVDSASDLDVSKPAPGTEKGLA